MLNRKISSENNIIKKTEDKHEHKICLDLDSKIIQNQVEKERERMTRISVTRKHYNKVCSLSPLRHSDS